MSSPPEPMPSRPDISVVVPTYGGAGSLPALVDGLHEALGDRAHEIILVNDASPDDAWEVISRLAATDGTIVGIDLLQNVGQPLATVCGIANSRGRLVATMDDDLQHPPGELPKLIDTLEANPSWDVAVGRWPRDGGPLRNFGSGVYEWFTRLAYRSPKGLRHSGFRVMRRPVADALSNYATRTPVLSSMLVEVSGEIHNVDVRHDERTIGESNFAFWDSVRTAATDFFRASELPLTILSRFGLVVATLSAIAAAVYLTRWAMGVQTPEGWASSFLATLFFGGVILFTLGLQGRYLGIITREVRQAPRWSVRRTALGGGSDRRIDTTDPLSLTVGRPGEDR